jgi:hypothetical protein
MKISEHSRSGYHDPGVADSPAPNVKLQGCLTNMNRILKVLLGVTTVIPLLYIFTVLFLFSDFRYSTIQKLHITVMAIYLFVLIVYSLDVRKNHRVPDMKRDLWSALIFLGSSAAQIIYFWFYIWPEDVDP